ncbi:HAMP domain-containing sensor histidine kinase [uncultured Pseudoflavonifractor sp.]|uniref:sensor histidine kinase n=1 Tax=uncultured Pseudoflavonifractor sp. TaxID=1221379 RepID=UPI0025E3ECC3|nr:HAMP domain-containing sensor histidine kinase [uncultured Pseudoflavonifractor sp.]
MNRKKEKNQERSAPRKVHLWSSLQTKFALTYIAVIAAVLVLLNTYPLLASRELVETSKQTALQSQASLISSALSSLRTMTYDGADGVFQELRLQDNVDLARIRILVTDAAGMIIYDTGETGATIGRYALVGEVVTALKGQGYDVFTCQYRDGVFRNRAAAPVVYRGSIIGAVCLYEYDADQGALLSGVQRNLGRISVIICLVALLLSAVFSRALTRRMGTLLKAIRIVREGEYSHRVQLGGHDELALLADEFDQLTGRLQTTEEVRRRFVSDASHELKTPLASIRLLTDSILQSDHMDPETGKEFVSDIGEEAERLTRITEKLLTLTRMDNAAPVHTEPVDVKYVVEKVEHMLSPLAKAVDVTLLCRLDEGCFVRATQDDIYQIAFNLMENAIKYNLPQGTVTVTLFVRGKSVLLRVEDTGVGIPEEDLPKVFDRFYRVDKARSREAGGTGLGLSIVRDTARQHGGSVTVRRRDPEPGTCFEVVFPLCQPEGGSEQ